MCTERRERGTRLDPLAGRQQAPFGEDVWAEEVGEERAGTRKGENDAAIDMHNEGSHANKASYSLPVFAAPSFPNRVSFPK